NSNMKIAHTLPWVTITVAQSFDYIIVGAGTAGLTLANRLSQDDKLTIALVDPGASEKDNAVVKDTLNWLEVSNTYINWNYTSVSQSHANGRKLQYSAGRGIGGTSLMNGMTYIRGDKAQFDAWEKLGNPGWNWNNLLPYYEKVERLFLPTENQQQNGAIVEKEYHGFKGDLHIGFIPVLDNSSFYDTARDTWSALGQDPSPDVNRGDTKGFSVWPQTLDPVKNVRSDAATSFYWPIVQQRHNLKLFNGTVSHLTWTPRCKTPKASGVVYINPKGDKVQLNAKKEVILAAGSLRSPLILERSGVGSKKLLQSMGISTILDLPGVGENMIDQTNLALIYESTKKFDGYTPYGTFANARDLFAENFTAVAATTRKQLSQWATTLASASDGRLSESALTKVFEIQHDLIFKQNVTFSELLTLASGNNLVSAVWPLLPFSRGSVHLGSNSDTAVNSPVIDPNFLAIDFDLDVNVATGKLAHKFWETSPVKEFVKSQVAPSADAIPPNASNEQWQQYIKQAFSSNSHALGTLAMMSKELGGVVGPDLRVHGVHNVRVIDASVIPTQISGHLTATIYAIADRAAHIILE
ncbi:hypothetical protein Golomagni_05704, partial [Golovinomyces magnicellulatus]